MLPKLVTRWLSHGAACKRTGKRYPIIIKLLDNITTIDPKVKLIGLRDQIFTSEILL